MLFPKPFPGILVTVLLSMPLLGQSQVFCGPMAGVDDAGGTSKDTVGVVPPYPWVREADVAWMKGGKSRIDLRERRNRPLGLPRVGNDSVRSLFDVLLCAIISEGSITAYEAGPIGTDESFQIALSPMQVLAMINRQNDTLPGFTSKPRGDEGPISNKDVVIYEVKEIWYFDRRTSEMHHRIIGLCPMVSRFDSEGIFRGYQPLFWIYYPQARQTLVEAAVYGNYKNNPALANYDALFLSRFLNTTIISQSSMNGRSISRSRTGKDALLESEQTAERIRSFEADMWSY